jgi:protoheme IX farnesyltransferase
MKSNSGSSLRDYLQLSKLKIMLPVSLTGFTGYFIYNPHVSVNIILVSFGLLLMAISASALNQVQEADLDSKMERTLHRPIPDGRIRIIHAVIFSIFIMLAGISLIWIFGNLTASLIGLFTILWYNGVYTYSKRITAFAVVPGSLTGALPPLIGWIAAGGGMLDKQIIFLEFLFFTGQIPHFWLLIIKYGEEYNKAGIPTLTDIFSNEQINRLTFIWVITSVIAALFLCCFEVIRSGTVILILLSASAFIVWRFSSLLKSGANRNTSKKYSILLDSYFLLILLLLIADKIIK